MIVYLNNFTSLNTLKEPNGLMKLFWDSPKVDSSKVNKIQWSRRVTNGVNHIVKHAKRYWGRTFVAFNDLKINNDVSKGKYIMCELQY